MPEGRDWKILKKKPKKQKNKSNAACMPDLPLFFTCIGAECLECTDIPYRFIIDHSIVALQVVFLPECFDYVGENREQTLSMAAPLKSPRMQSLRDLAKELGVWLSLGGFHEKVCTHSNLNRTYLFMFKQKKMNENDLLF